mmetsp:Transcript_14008/g.19620  ORF Transcript_14008/g.19620 Transcript_14008/m.19620 type:complete len:731 (+) Transcript_14008:49-2241(+)
MTAAAPEAPSSNVRVVARIRPLSGREIDNGSKETVTSMNPKAMEVDKAVTESFQNIADHGPELVQAAASEGGAKRWFELDAVFDKSCTQEEVYVRSGSKKAVCEEIFKGYNCTILAYGQTGAGKTFSMGTAAHNDGGKGDHIGEMDGLIPRACVDLFAQIKERCDGNAKVELSYLEIYNEEIKDLLNPSEDQKLAVRETLNGEIYVSGLTEKEVKSPTDIGKLMEEASKRRVVAATAMNAVSSRSHAICTLKIAGVLENPGTNDVDKFSSKLTLVDLAGSERIKKTGATGGRRKEGISINQGLFVLGQVVSALSEQGKKHKSGARKPPYRDSKLTRLLQDSLGGNSRTIMVACVSPADFNFDESVNTLRYATSARNIKNSATRNIVKNISPEEAAALRRENQLLKTQVTELQAELSRMTMPISSTNSTVSLMTDDDMSIASSTAPGPVEDKEDNDGDSAQIAKLEKVVATLKKELKAQKADYRKSVKSSAIEMPAMKVELAKLREEHDKTEEIEQENQELLEQLEEVKADAESARLAASKLSDILDQLKRIKRDELYKKKVTYNHLKKKEAWIEFVEMLLARNREQMDGLSNDFDLVMRVVDSNSSPACMKSEEKSGFFGRKTGKYKDVFDPALRHQILMDHVNFYKGAIEDIQKEVLLRSVSIQREKESIKKVCTMLEDEIGDDEETVENSLELGEEHDMVANLTKLLIEPVSVISKTGREGAQTPYNV